jgi:DNA-binding protein HU-beta
MIKADFINEMQKNTGSEDNHWSKADCAFAVEAFIQAVTDTVAEGEKISFVGFGSFEAVETKEKNGVNPATKEKIVIPASKKVRFKAGKAFKDAVKGA